MEDNKSKTTPYADMPNHEFDEKVLSMQESIQKQAAVDALVSQKFDVLELMQDYSDDDSIYLTKIEEISQIYSHMRKTRGDGNCFYRSLGFGYMEYLIHNPTLFSSFKKRLEATRDILEKLGYPTFTVDDFYEQFIEVVENVEKRGSVESLKETFCDEGISNYLVVYLRLITSGYLQENCDFYQNFIEDGRSVVDFCKGEVEPMDRESDHIHIIAITSALNISIRVAYVDRGEVMTYHNFPEDMTAEIHLLYRPGHYDILYKR